MEKVKWIDDQTDWFGRLTKKERHFVAQVAAQTLFELGDSIEIKKDGEAVEIMVTSLLTFYYAAQRDIVKEGWNEG